VEGFISIPVLFFGLVLRVPCASIAMVEMETSLLMNVCVVGGNAVSAFLSWRLQATNACDVTLVWKSGFDAVSQYGITFKYVIAIWLIKSFPNYLADQHPSAMNDSNLDTVCYSMDGL
jgi:hypothetical protein